MRVLQVLILLIGCGMGAPQSAAEPVHNPWPPDINVGQAIYNTYCVACHRADGTGYDEKLAASFVGPNSPLGKPDEVLLKSIGDGVQGSIGVMPGWNGIIGEQAQKDVLAYIRKTFED